MLRACFLAATWSILCGAALAADWPTHRGNSARTGNADGLPGPSQPKLLWVHKSKENYVASPVAGEKALYLSGLGAFNTASLHAVELGPAAAQRVVWSKLPPALKLPVVSAPAVFGSQLIFGDGMHQTDGASLHGLHAASGLPLWRYNLPGTLVHIEGAPTVAGGRVYIGGGHAGVLCLDTQKLTLGGQAITAEAALAKITAEWQKLLASYEADKKKDPDFAIPPSEDALPKPAPSLVWQQGKGAWHVDSPVNVAGERVLVASAFLDLEKSGDRALYCLSAADGATQWKTPLALNPWSGATVAGDLALVAGSSIRFDPKLIAVAKGELTAIQLADGMPKWRKQLPGAVVSSVAVANGLALAAGTDGKVRALDVTTGAIRWTYEAGAPLFAGAAVAGETVYVADLKGVVHALKLADGVGLWKLDLATNPQVGAGGMVFGSPIVHGGRLYVATCNLESTAAGQQQAIVCIGEK